MCKYNENWGGGTIILDILSKKPVVLIGLPCDIASVLTLLKNKNIDGSSLVTIDLVCGGTTLADVGAQYIEYLEKKYKSKLVEFSVRYKNPEWTPPFLRAVFENGMVFCKRFYETDYGYAFEHMKKSACYSCRWKGENHLSDATIGDGWGIDKEDPGYNAAGVSVAFVHTEKGKALLEELQNFSLYEADWNKMEAGNPRYTTPKPRLQKDDQFRADYQKYGLQKACKKACGLKKRLLGSIPESAINLLRKIKQGVEKNI